MSHFEDPINEENIKLIAFIKERIVSHEENAEECTCHEDYGEVGGCWYRLSEKEQWDLRFDAIFTTLAREAADGYPSFITTDE